MAVVLNNSPISHIAFDIDHSLPPESMLTRMFSLCAGNEMFLFLAFTTHAPFSSVLKRSRQMTLQKKSNIESGGGWGNLQCYTVPLFLWLFLRLDHVQSWKRTTYECTIVPCTLYYSECFRWYGRERTLHSSSVGLWKRKCRDASLQDPNAAASGMVKSRRILPKRNGSSAICRRSRFFLSCAPG